MKQPLIFCTIVLLFASCKKDALYTNVTASVEQNDAKIPGYTLVWRDEFDYTGLPDENKWGYERGYVRNHEKQYYIAARLKNSRVEDGHLVITARNDNYENHQVTSASITTKDKMQFLYGKIVVRAKMPIGAGSWPAIWMLGINRPTVHWPDCGEIDILEWLGRTPQLILGSMYMPGGFLLGYSSRVTSYNVGDNTTLSAQYHMYSIDWDSTQIKYYYDGYNYATYKAAGMTVNQWAPFKKPQYLLLNLAMGGTSGGPINETKYPFIYLVDFVRYYQQK